MTAETRYDFDSSNSVRLQPEHAAVLDDIVLKLPACVCLDGEWMAIIPTDEGINKYSIRVEEQGGVLRALTQDEEIALAIAPASESERAAAAQRVRMPDEELRLILLPEPWQRGDLEVVLMQLERCFATRSG
jgi:hypothetical protein